MKRTDKKRKKRSVTLIEMIVVMLLIATITGALAYNYNKSLDEGKAFKTREGISRIQTILSLELAKGDKDASAIQSGWENIVKNSPLAGSGDITKDGWGKTYDVSFERNQNDEENFKVSSQGLSNFEARKQRQQ